jgi:hypothetical protein
MPRSNVLLSICLAAGPALGCAPSDTSHLTPEQEARFTQEGILHRGANLTFRYTHDAGSRDAGWENRVASIVVTKQSVLIYKNEKIGIEVTPASRRAYQVHREADRVRITAGSGGSRETWSFTPPDSADAWTEAIRAVIKASKSASNEP